MNLDGLDIGQSVTCLVTHQPPGQKLRFSFPLLLLLIDLYLNVYFEDWTYNLNIICNLMRIGCEKKLTPENGFLQRC